MLAGTPHDQEFLGLRPAFRDCNRAATAEELTSHGVLGLHHGLGYASGDDAPAVLASAWPHVDEPVRLAHGVFIVLHHDHGVADVAQPGERLQQTVIISLVQADRGLVEDVEHAHKARPDLRGEPDALRLPTGERRRTAVERQVTDTNVVQKRQALNDLAEDPLGNQAFGLGQLERLRPGDRLLDRLVRGFVDRHPADRDGEAFRLQPGAVAVRTRPQGHPLLDALLLRLRLCFVVPALEACQQSLPRHAVCTLAPEAVLVRDHDPLTVRTAQEVIALLLGQLAPRLVEWHVETFCDAEDQLLEEVGARDVPRLQRPALDRDGGVWLHEIRVELGQRTQPMTVRTRTVRAIEREDAWRQLRQRDAVVGACEALRERHCFAIDNRDVE